MNEYIYIVGVDVEMVAVRGPAGDWVHMSALRSLAPDMQPTLPLPGYKWSLPGHNPTPSYSTYLTQYWTGHCVAPPEQ